MKHIQNKKSDITLHGRAINGRGRASEDLADLLERYDPSKTFEKGTLNVIMTEPIIFDTKKSAAMTLDQTERYVWEGTLNGYPILIYRWKGCRSHVIEVISDTNLRKKFHISNNDPVRIEIQKDLLKKAKIIHYVTYAAFWSLGRTAWPYRCEAYQKALRRVEGLMGTLQ